MKYLIEWMEIKTSAKGNKYATLTLKDEEGKTTEATIFTSFIGFDSFKPGSSIEGELKSRDYKGNVTYTLEQPNSSPRGNFAPKKDISAGVALAQERKERSIEKAQDRSAWMHAKNNAVTLLQNDPRMATADNDIKAEIVMDLATKIYHGEPLLPF